MKKIPVKKYKYTNHYDGRIRKVQIVRETNHSVFFPRGDSARKETQDQIYCDTPKEAFEFALMTRRREMNRRRGSFEYAEKRYNDLVKKGMKMWEKGKWDN